MRAIDLLNMVNEDMLRDLHLAIETYLGDDNNAEDRDEIKSIANNNRYSEFLSNGKVKELVKSIQHTTYAPLSTEVLASYMGIKR